MSNMPDAPPLRRFVSANETEVECLAGKTHDWYFKEGLGDSDSLTLVRARVEQGSGHPFHSHPEMDEIIYVLAGSMEQWLEKESRTLGPGDTVYIPRGVIHGCYNVSESDCVFLAILTPSKIQGPFSVDHSEEEPWRSLRPG